MLMVQKYRGSAGDPTNGKGKPQGQHQSRDQKRAAKDLRDAQRDLAELAANRTERKTIQIAASARAKAMLNCASEYWFTLYIHNGPPTYLPDQRCRCPQCLTDIPDRRVNTPDGPMTLRGGRLWPRQAAQISVAHYECRQLQLAPRPHQPKSPWKRRSKARADDAAWCGGERGCWRRKFIMQDEAVIPHTVHVRQGTSRDTVAVEESSVVAAVEMNLWGIASQQVDDPDLLEELNGICEEGEDSGLIDSLASLDGGSSAVVASSGKRQGRDANAIGAERPADELGQQE